MADDTEKILKGMSAMLEPFKRDLSDLRSRVQDMENASSNTYPNGESLEAKPYHPSRFQVTQITDDKEEIYCPSCGGFERRKVPVKTVEKTIEVEKPTIPENWMPAPTKYEDIEHILNDLPHPDDHHLLDCPNCAPKFEAWLNKNGFVKQQKKK